MNEANLAIAGAAALGLIGLGGAAIAMRRRKRRRENEDFESRQQALATIDDEPTLELDPADEIRPAPAFVRAPTPVHDPVPAARSPAKLPADASASIPGQGNWESRPDSDFLFRRADKNAKAPVEQN